MKIVGEPFAGTFVIEPRTLRDERGSFVKTFHKGDFANLGWSGSWAEEFYSVSSKNVVRGMHFQTPPHAHDKLVYCVAGSVLDVLLDLRTQSATFGQYFSIELDSSKPRLLLIPAGIAHGFLSLKEESLMVYKTTAVYAQENDAGIRWDSFDFNWPITSPIISARDRAFPRLGEFTSPF